MARGKARNTESKLGSQVVHTMLRSLDLILQTERNSEQSWPFVEILV